MRKESLGVTIFFRIYVRPYAMNVRKTISLQFLIRIDSNEPKVLIRTYPLQTWKFPRRTQKSAGWIRKYPIFTRKHPEFRGWFCVVLWREG